MAPLAIFLHDSNLRLLPRYFRGESLKAEGSVAHRSGRRFRFEPRPRDHSLAQESPIPALGKVREGRGTRLYC